MTKQIFVAKALIINDKNQALVLFRSPWPARPERSHQPDLPGGMVEKGESERFAAVREIEEETGIAVDSEALTLGYTLTSYYAKKDESISKFLYIAKLNNTPNVQMSWEHESYEWCALDTILDTHTFTPFYQEGLKYLLAYKLI